ncbi:MAG TPA: hypothetical protein VMU82_15535 [Acetobacteraceae bacterium]|nr:hypothetical protein [Acetobacteraceae bacterium]
MTPDLMATTLHLIETLEEENAALAALDLPRASALLAQKQRAAEGFTTACAAAPPCPADREAVRASADRLRRAASENQRLLAHAILVQGQVIGAVARAMAQPLAAPRYGATGDLASGRRAAPVALSASV